jgi:hypothetical protein
VFGAGVAPLAGARPRAQRAVTERRAKLSLLYVFTVGRPGLAFPAHDGIALVLLCPYRLKSRHIDLQFE